MLVFFQVNYDNDLFFEQDKRDVEMRIAVNTRLLRKDRLDGIGWFEYNTLKWICKLHPDTEFHFLLILGYTKNFYLRKM